jgi:hypothetical protein
LHNYKGLSILLWAMLLFSCPQVVHKSLPADNLMQQRTTINGQHGQHYGQCGQLMGNLSDSITLLVWSCIGTCRTTAKLPFIHNKL